MAKKLIIENIQLIGAMRSKNSNAKFQKIWSQKITAR